MKLKKKHINESMSCMILYLEGDNNCTNLSSCSGSNTDCTNYGNCKC